MFRTRTASPGGEEEKAAASRQKAIDFADGVVAEILSGNKGNKAAIDSRLKTRLSEASGGGAKIEGENGKAINGVKNTHPELQNERYSIAMAGAPLAKKTGLYIGDAPMRDDPALKEAYNAYGIVHEIFDNPDYGVETKKARLEHHIGQTDTTLDGIRSSNKRSYLPFLDIRNEIYRRALAGLGNGPEKAPDRKEEKKPEDEPKTGTGTVPETKNPTPTGKTAPPLERPKYKPEQNNQKNTEFPDNIEVPGTEKGKPGGGISSIGRIRRNRTA